MSGQAPERKLAKGLGIFSFGLGVAQLAAPDRVNKLIGVKDTTKARAIQRGIGVHEVSAAQGIFAFSPPTPVLWTRVAGDIVHLGLLAKALDGRRNDRARLLRAIGAVAGIGLLDTLVAARYQVAWPKEPTPGETLPTAREGRDEELEAHVDGNPAITILATEAEIRPKLQQAEIASYGDFEFRAAPGGHGTEVLVKTTKNTDKVKAELRKLKQQIEVGEVVVSDSAPEGADAAKRQLGQRPAQPLAEKELAKTGGRS